MSKINKKSKYQIDEIPIFVGLKRLTAILLMLLFLSAGFRDLLTFAHYYLYQDYIANTWCVNKFDLEEMCRGKCYLGQQLEISKEQQGAHFFFSQLIDHLELNLLCTDGLDSLSAAVALLHKSHLGTHETLYLSNHLFEIFHPPQVSLPISELV
ncbi:MAG: hypothetical protein AAGG75_10675 [Bacteroidota bacterium]